MLAAGFLACAAPTAQLEPCALEGPPSANDVIVEATGRTGFMLVDGRPLVVPRQQRHMAGCNVGVLRLSPGPHTIHSSFQVTGFSPWVGVSYSALECSLDAEPGRHYQIDCGTGFSGHNVCKLTDAESGRVLERRQRSDTDLNAYFEVVRAYAACGDELGLSEVEKIRDSGRLRRPPQDWEPGECRAFVDLR